MKTLLWLITAAATTLPLAAQDHSMLNDIVKHLKTSKEYTVDIAKQMPADSYGFKANPAEMSFAEQMNHIASANSMFGAVLHDAKPKEYKDQAKDAVIASLNDSFDNAIAAVGQLKEGDLWTVKKGPEGEMSVMDSLLLMLDHTTHHRAQCIVYLRVKGIKPAEYRF